MPFSTLTIAIQGAGHGLSVDVIELRRFLRRLGTRGRRELSKAVVAGETLLRGQSVNVIGLVYPDGKTINVLVEKSANSKAVAMSLVGLAPNTFATRLEVVTENSNWIQFYGKIPEGVESFELKAKRSLRTLPLTDGTAGAQGQGHVKGSRSWKNGAHWSAEFDRYGIRFVLNPDAESVSVLGISTGLGRIKLQLGYSASNENLLPNVTLRARKSGQEIMVPVSGDSRQGVCIIDGFSIGESISRLPAGQSTWDVLSNGVRLRIGQTDIADPRAAFRFGWIVARSGATYVKIRPYWTLNKKLSLEMKLTAALDVPNIP